MAVRPGGAAGGDGLQQPRRVLAPIRTAGAYALLLTSLAALTTLLLAALLAGPQLCRAAGGKSPFISSHLDNLPKPQPLADLTGPGADEAPGGYYILAMAYGTPPQELCTFLSSWHMHEPNSHMVLFVADAAAKALLTSSYPGVQVYVLRPWNTAEWYLMQWRHFVYAQYLSSRAHLAPRGVLLSDARDVAFNAPLWQRQPVQEQLAAGNVVFALEGDCTDEWKWTVGMKGTTFAWMQMCFGPEVWQPMQDAPERYPTSCAGTTFGSGLAVLKYVIAMARTMDASPLSCRKCGDQGCDQAVHNYLMHVAAKQPGRLGFNVTRWGNCESPLYTLMMVFAAGYSVQMDVYGTVHVVRSSKFNFTPSVLHQIDRSPVLHRAIQHARTCSPAGAYYGDRVELGAEGRAPLKT